jgi:hypothetical protein
MSQIPQCGDAPVDSVLAIALTDGVSLTLVRSADGYCFSAWSRHDFIVMPLVSDEDRLRVFESVEAATEYFRLLCQQL